MAIQTVELAEALAGQVRISCLWDDQSGAVTAIVVDNATVFDAWISAAGHALTFGPGTTQQDVTAFGLSISKTTRLTSFPYSTRIPA